MMVMMRLIAARCSSFAIQTTTEVKPLLVTVCLLDADLRFHSLTLDYLKAASQPVNEI